MISLEYLEDERKKLWEKILALEKDIINKTPEYEKEAKVSSKKTSEYKNRCNDARETAENYVIEIKNKLYQKKIYLKHEKTILHPFNMWIIG